MKQNLQNQPCEQRPGGPQLCIVAADDEKIALGVLERAIMKAEPGARVSAFLTAQEVLSHVSREHCDVAFLDIELGGMNGLELAKRLKEANPSVNIVFVTGYDRYLRGAFELHASGYIMKPATPELIERELSDLRRPVRPEQTKRARAKTFGTFEFYVDGEPLRFRLSRTKELLAYLIDRQGASSNTAELCAVLFEDGSGTASCRSHFRTLVADLSTSLGECGMGALFIKRRNSFAIDPALMDCDMYRFLSGDVSAVNAYNGEYMSPYSWAELRTGWLESER